MTSEIRLPPTIKPGDVVRLVSPASFPDRALVDEYLEILDDWGLQGEVAPHALDRRGYMAGSDLDRLDDLNNAFRDPAVRAIVTTRGGAGAYRIADHIDFDAVRADPKPLVGFSDITNIHLSLLKNCQLGGIHGCLIGHTARASVRKLLMSTDPIELRRIPDSVSASAEVPGLAHGRLVGGNLTALTSSIGVRMPSLSGAILFLEDQKILGLGTVDRQLTQLIESRTLDGIAGIALGSFEDFDGYSDRGWSLSDLFKDRLEQLGVPIIGGFFAGHGLVGSDGTADQSALPLGSMATLDANNGTLTVNPIVS